MLQFLGPIANLAGTWLENKVEKTKADGQAKVAEAKARATVAEKVAAGKLSGKARWLAQLMAHGKMNLPSSYY